MPLELATVGAALGALKTITEIAKSVNNIELNQKIIELQSSVLDMQQQMTVLLDENRNLKNEVQQNKDSQASLLDMEFVEDGGYYVRVSERNAGQKVRYCAVCWGKKSLLVPLSRVGDPGTYYCVPHKTYFRTSEYTVWNAQRPARPPRRISPWMSV